MMWVIPSIKVTNRSNQQEKKIQLLGLLETIFKLINIEIFYCWIMILYEVKIVTNQKKTQELRLAIGD